MTCAHASAAAACAAPSPRTGAATPGLGARAEVAKCRTIVPAARHSCARSAFITEQHAPRDGLRCGAAAGDAAAGAGGVRAAPRLLMRCAARSGPLGPRHARPAAAWFKQRHTGAPCGAHGARYAAVHLCRSARILTHRAAARSVGGASARRGETSDPGCHITPLTAAGRRRGRSAAAWPQARDMLCRPRAASWLPPWRLRRLRPWWRRLPRAHAVQVPAPALAPSVHARAPRRRRRFR